MIDIPDNGGGVFRLYFLTDAGALFSLPLSNQIFCLCSSLLSAFWHLPLSVPPLLSPGRIPAMASKGKARGELSVFPAAGADQLRRAGAPLRGFFFLNKRTSFGGYAQTASGSNAKREAHLCRSLGSVLSIYFAKLFQLINLEDAPRSAD